MDNVYSGAPSGLFSTAYQDVAPAPLSDFSLPLSPRSFASASLAFFLLLEHIKHASGPCPCCFIGVEESPPDIQRTLSSFHFCSNITFPDSDLTSPYTIHPPLPAALLYTLELLHFL